MEEGEGSDARPRARKLGKRRFLGRGEGLGAEALFQVSQPFSLALEEDMRMMGLV